MMRADICAVLGARWSEIMSGPVRLSRSPSLVSKSCPYQRELPLSELAPLLTLHSDPLSHAHISFMHVYKEQGGWTDVLRRFTQGKGTLYDLEFLEDENKRRVAAFGYAAGFAGAAAGALALAAQQQSGGQGKLGGLKPYQNEAAMVKHVSEGLRGIEGGVENVKVLVIGALGRCGRGAVDLFRKVGVQE